MKKILFLPIIIFSIYPFQKSFSIDTQQSNSKITQQENTNNQFVKDIPTSIIKNQKDDKKHQEIYKLGCPGNTQHTTQDMENCEVTIIKQLTAIQNKYISLIKSQIKEDNKDDPTLLKETLDSFDDENVAWDILINKASRAMLFHQGGTVSNTVALSREVSLIKLRIHEQWLSWIQLMDGSSILPEPLFNETH